MRPSPSSPVSRFTASAALVVAATLASLGVTPAAAAPVTLLTAACPQAVALVGFPIEPIEVQSGDTLRITVGVLPGGVEIDEPGGVLFGVPTTTGRAMFRVQLDARQPDGSVVSSSANCAVDVKDRPTVNRLAAEDRYAQSVTVSSSTFSSSDLAYVATGETFADALSATSVATAHRAPLLLTPTASVRPDMLAELTRLGAKRVVIVGGESAVSKKVLQAIDGVVDSVVRVGGADRYAVSRALITDPAFGIPASASIFLATGRNFPDALTASPAAAHTTAPVLLVDGSASALSDPETKLLDELGVREVTIVGGVASMSAALYADVNRRSAVERLAGRDRYEGGAVVNQAIFRAASVVFLASGATFPDALSGGVSAGIGDNPLYVTTPECLSGDVWAEIGRLAPDTVTVLGGSAALGPKIDRLEPCSAD